MRKASVYVLALCAGRWHVHRSKQYKYAGHRDKLRHKRQHCAIQCEYSLPTLSKAPLDRKVSTTSVLRPCSQGGGAYIYKGTVTFDSVTISGNTAGVSPLFLYYPRPPWKVGMAGALTGLCRGLENPKATSLRLWHPMMETVKARCAVQQAALITVLHLRTSSCYYHSLLAQLLNPSLGL